jgi:hypothetical protein
LSVTQRVSTESSEACVPVLQNVYLSVRRTQTELYRIGGFEDSLEPDLQDLYRDFSQPQAKEIFLHLGMSSSRSEATLVTATQSARTCRFNLGLTSEQSRFLQDVLSDNLSLSAHTGK